MNRIYNNSLTQTQAENIGVYESSSYYNYYVGNVFYKTGIVTITSPYTEYAALVDNTGSYTLEARGTRRIDEWEMLCTVHGSEFNMPTNPSCTLTNGNYASFVTHSDFNPYVTQIGLYNDNNDLLAIAKPSQPIRKPETMDLTFAIRFDT